jgi:hypothetical protein
LDKFADFKRIYDGDLSIERGNRYFGIMRDYFSAFSDFGQVHFLVVKGIGVDGGQTASSVNFAMTRMFYGNAFETFSASVDVLAYLNNLSSGRDFDKFKKFDPTEIPGTRQIKPLRCIRYERLVYRAV